MLTQDKSLPHEINLKELWEAMARISKNIVDDNLLYEDNWYPTDVRKHQIVGIEALVSSIKKLHSQE